MKNKDFIQSFNNAYHGILYALKNEKNLRIHFIVALFVLFFSLIADISKIELIILLITISLVIVCELFNTAIEVIVNVMIKVYHPKAKIIKDVAAGAVLLSSTVAIIIGYLIFVDRLSPNMQRAVDSIKNFPPHIILISLLVTVISVFVVKTLTKKGTPFQGGFPSGHAAIAFSIVTAVALWTGNMNITILCTILALLVAQSRIEGKIHTFYEVFMGAVLGTLITLLIFKLFWPV